MLDPVPSQLLLTFPGGEVSMVLFLFTNYIYSCLMAKLNLQTEISKGTGLTSADNWLYTRTLAVPGRIKNRKPKGVPECRQSPLRLLFTGKTRYTISHIISYETFFNNKLERNKCKPLRTLILILQTF